MEVFDDDSAVSVDANEIARELSVDESLSRILADALRMAPTSVRRRSLSTALPSRVLSACLSTRMAPFVERALSRASFASPFTPCPS